MPMSGIWPSGQACALSPVTWAGQVCSIWLLVSLPNSTNSNYVSVGAVSVVMEQLFLHTDCHEI